MKNLVVLDYRSVAVGFKGKTMWDFPLFADADVMGGGLIEQGMEFLSRLAQRAFEGGEHAK